MSSGDFGLCRILIFGLICSVIQAKRFQPVQSTSANALYLKETNRVLRSYIESYSVQCPSATKPNGFPVKFEELYWLNENNDFSKPDGSIFVSSANLIEKAQLTVRINQQINYVSCGYLYNNVYKRIKQWNFIYVDAPEIKLIVTSNPNQVSLKPINSTYSSISVPASSNVASWNSPLDLLRFKCQTNYDIPLDTRFVWMYYKNPVTGNVEIWHRDDVKGVEDVYQIFMYDLYNSVTNRNESLSTFIKSLLLDRVDSIEFQCASYKDNFQLLAKSPNFYLIKDKGHPIYTYPFHSTTAVTVVTEGSRYDNGPLIGGIIGGILGLLLLLALILLLVWCCCIRRRKEKDTQIKFYNQQNMTSQSVVSGYPTENNIEITQDGWRNMTGTSSAFMHFPTQSCHTLDNQSSRHHSHMESSNLNRQQAISQSNLSHHHLNHNQSGIATIRSEAPDLYLKTITLPKDMNDDYIRNDGRPEGFSSTYAQKDITYNSNSGYLTDEEFYTHRKEYLVDNNGHHQQHHEQAHFQYV